MKRLLCVLLVLISVSVVLMPSVFADTTFIVTNENGEALSTPSQKAGKDFSVMIGFKPSDPNLNVDIFADIIVSTDISAFPFEIRQTNYQQTLKKNSSGVYAYNFNMKSDSNAAAGYYTINFKLTYNDGTEDIECTVPVVMKVTGGSTPSVPDNMPRITITAFSASPDPVVAGEEITLSVTFTNNTSGVTAKNVKAQLSSDGTFTPVSGSSSMFLGNIDGSGSVKKSIKLKVKADVAPSSYTVTFELTYDVDGIEDQISDSETVSIPVVQVPKLQVSNPQMYPEEVYAGQDMNFMASLNNTGRSTLYNVNIAFEDTSGCFEGQEQYLGNIEPGGTKSVDVYLSAVMEGEALLTMTITYEDQDGEIYTFTDSYPVFVMVRGDVDPKPWPEDPETNGGGFVWIIILVIVLLVAGGLVAFIFIRRKKKAELSKQLDQQQIAQLEWEYNQQMAGEAYTVDGDMSATTEMPIANPDAEIDEVVAQVEKSKNDKKTSKEKASQAIEVPESAAKQDGETAKSETGEMLENSEENGQSGETRV